MKELKNEDEKYFIVQYNQNRSSVNLFADDFVGVFIDDDDDGEEKARLNNGCFGGRGGAERSRTR